MPKLQIMNRNMTKIESFDDVLETVGSWGKYQKLIVFLVLQPALFPCAFNSYNAVFMAATPSDYWCRIPLAGNAHLSDSTIKEYFLPQEQREGKLQHSQCKAYPELYDNNTIFRPENKSLPVGCAAGWKYDQSVYQDTVVTTFDLVCDRSLLSAASFAIAAVGGIVGTMFWGILADRYGRKLCYFSILTFQTIFSLATGFAPNYWWYCVCRFFVGSTTAFIYSLCYLLSVELTGPDTRSLLSVICSAGYTLSVVVIVGIASAVRSWQLLSFTSALSLLPLFLLWPFFPESPRWLLLNGRYRELQEFLRRTARINGITLPEDFSRNLPRILKSLNSSVDDDVEKHSTLDLFRTPNMRKKTLTLIFVNFCNYGVFTGINLYAPGFGDQPHLNSLFSGLVEFPPYIFATFICDKFGRRASLSIGLLLAAASALTAVGVPETAGTILLLFTLATKFFITFTFMLGELLEEEIFPTVVRAEGASLTIIMASFAGAASPFVVYLGQDLVVLPLAIFGLLCFAAAIVALFLPETLGTELPQTLADGERIGKDLTWGEIFSWRLPKNLRPKAQVHTQVAESSNKNGAIPLIYRPADLDHAAKSNLLAPIPEEFS